MAPRRAPRVTQRTPLQTWLVVLFDVLLDARDELGAAEYTALIFIATERLGIESARLLLGEALRAARDDTRRAA